MPEDQPPQEKRRFYRRVRNDQWQQEDQQTLKDTVFYIKGSELGLSVFDAAFAVPRTVLEHLLQEWDQIAARSEKDQRWVAKQWEKHGKSVEALVASGWGVTVVTEDLFVRCGFQPSSQIDPNGHLEILGTKEAFEEQSLEIIDDPECWILSEEECLAQWP